MSLYKKPLNIIVILSLLFSNTLFSQTNNQHSQKIIYAKSVTVSASKSEIKEKVFNWFQGYYKNASSIIKSNNETGLIANPHFRILNPKTDNGIETTAGIINYTIKIHFNDGKYKYELAEFYLKKHTKHPIEKWKDTSSSDYKQKYAYYLEQVDKYAKETIASLEKSMLN